MQLHRRHETTLNLWVTRFRGHPDQRLRNTIAIKVLLKETRRTFLCFEDGHTILKTVAEVPTTEKLEAFSLDGFLSLELSSKATCSVLHGLFSDVRKERYFEGVVSVLAHEHAKAAVASEFDTVALEVEFEVMTNILEPRERCFVCLVEFQLREAVERKPCGHLYHEDCMEYYIKRHIDCPTCYYEPKSSSKSSSGAREFASEENIIKVCCDFLNTDSDESEEESSDEPVEKCTGCLAECGPRKVEEGKPCGHTYHEDCCMDNYIKHDIKYQMCQYDVSF